MSTTIEFIEYVCEQLRDVGVVRYSKMFGEYMVYVNDKPVLLVCDDTVFVKQLDVIAGEMTAAGKGFPYDGAKEHYILDIDDGEFSRKIAGMVETVTPIPKKKVPKGEKAKTVKANESESKNESFAAAVELFDRSGGWYYVVAPKSLCQPYYDLQERGLIAVTASAKSGDAQLTWQTSLLPMGDGSHFLALPAKVRNKLRIGTGDRVEIEFSIRRR